MARNSFDSTTDTAKGQDQRCDYEHYGPSGGYAWVEEDCGCVGVVVCGEEGEDVCPGGGEAEELRVAVVCGSRWSGDGHVHDITVGIGRFPVAREGQRGVLSMHSIKSILEYFQLFNEYRLARAERQQTRLSLKGLDDVILELSRNQQLGSNLGYEPSLRKVNALSLMIHSYIDLMMSV